MRHTGSSLRHAGSLVAACILLVAACRLLSCGTPAGSSSPTRHQTRAPCIGSMGVLPTGPPGKSLKALLTCQALLSISTRIHVFSNHDNHNQISDRHPYSSHFRDEKLKPKKVKTLTPGHRALQVAEPELPPFTSIFCFESHGG